MDSLDDLVILHLSDLHISNEEDTYSRLLIELLNDIQLEIENVRDKSLVVVVTGDLLHQGPQLINSKTKKAKNKSSNALEAAKKFFSDLYEIIKDKVVGIYIVPGNHDKKRTNKSDFRISNFRLTPNFRFDKKEKTYVDKSVFFDDDFFAQLWSEQLECYDDKVGTGYISLVNYIYNLFGVDCRKRNDVEKTYGVDLLSVNDKKICFVSLNTAWSCIDDFDNRELVFGKFQIDSLKKQYNKCISSSGRRINPDLTIVLGHHPLSSFRGYEEDNLLAEMISYESFDADVYLCGHTHDRNVTNRTNVRHSLTTLVSGIGWPENKSGDHVSKQHTYSMYVFNTDLRSIDIYVKSTDDHGKFQYDYSIYGMPKKDRKKMILPLSTFDSQTYIPISRNKGRSEKGIYITSKFLDDIKNFEIRMSDFRAVIGSIMNNDRLSFFEDCLASSDDESEKLMSVLYDYLLLDNFDDFENETLIEEFFKAKENQTYEFLLTFLEKLCSKFYDIIVKQFLGEKEIVRIHFRYLFNEYNGRSKLVDESKAKYRSLCTSIPSEYNEEDYSVSEMPFCDLLKESFVSEKCLIYSANKHLVLRRPLNKRWKNFITIVPCFDENKYKICNSDTRDVKYIPYLTFGISANTHSYDWLFYCMDFFEYNDTIKEIIHKYINLFKIDLSGFCKWAASWLESERKVQ